MTRPILNGNLFKGSLSIVLLLLVQACTTTSTKIVNSYPPVVNYALSLQGAPYRYGKASPEEGFDCSGFVQHVYAQQGIYLPRTVREMAENLPVVAATGLQAGDLLLFNTQYNRPSHVGLYIEDKQFIHAPSSRAGKVQISKLDNRYWRERFVGVRRPAINKP